MVYSYLAIKAELLILFIQQRINCLPAISRKVFSDHLTDAVHGILSKAPDKAWVDFAPINLERRRCESVQNKHSFGY